MAGCWVSLGLSLHQLRIREYPFKIESYRNISNDVNCFIRMFTDNIYTDFEHYIFPISPNELSYLEIFLLIQTLFNILNMRV